MLNIAAITGRLTADPELRHTGTDIAVCPFTVAVDRGYVKAGAARQADFIDCVAWRQTAEFLSKYFSKGKMISVEASIQTRTYTDNAGNKRKATELVVSKIHFTESKKADGSQGGGDSEFVEIGGSDDLPF